MYVEMIDARGEFPLTRIAVVKKWYTQQYGWSEDDVITTILEPYEREANTNYSKLDPKSIMMCVFDLFRSIQELIQPFTCRYSMPAAMNKEHVDIPLNNELSDIDKAYMAINYPRDLPSVKKALQTINLDSKTTLAIIKAHEVHDVLEMRRLLVAHPSSFPSSRRFFGTSHPVAAVNRTIRRLPEAFRPMWFKSTLLPEAVVNSSPSPSDSTLVETGSTLSFCSQTTVSTLEGSRNNPSPKSSV
jgi:hypothetical protein